MRRPSIVHPFGYDQDRRPSSIVAQSLIVNRQSSIVYLLLLALLIPSLGQAQGEQEPPNRAGLVIRHGDGRVTTACVSFSEPSISGLDLLRRSGVPFIAQESGLGVAVCKLDGEGCEYPVEDCFCKRDGPTTLYWAYNRLVDGSWTFSQLGASSITVEPGDVEGWAWGAGSAADGAQPPVVPFEQICTAPASVSTPPTAINRSVAAPPQQPSVSAPAPAPSSNYVAFGVLVLLLGGGIIIAWRRAR